MYWTNVTHTRIGQVYCERSSPKGRDRDLSRCCLMFFSGQLLKEPSSKRKKNELAEQKKVSPPNFSPHCFRSVRPISGCAREGNRSGRSACTRRCTGGTTWWTGHHGHPSVSNPCGPPLSSWPSSQPPLFSTTILGCVRVLLIHLIITPPVKPQARTQRSTLFQISR